MDLQTINKKIECLTSEADEFKRNVFRAFSLEGQIFLLTVIGNLQEGFSYKVVPLNPHYIEIKIDSETEPKILRLYASVMENLLTALPEKDSELTNSVIRVLSHKLMDHHQ